MWTTVTCELYHVEFKFRLVSKPLVQIWLSDSLVLKIYNKTIIEFGLHMISWIIKTSCLCYLPQPSFSADSTDLGFDIHDIMLSLIQ